MTLETNLFVGSLVVAGYTHLCVVPCSYAKDFINSVINLNKIQYIPCASEAVACSVASGLKMSGEKPIVLVQSSGLTNMGSCLTSLNNPYDICFPIIVSWRKYQKNDSEIQHKHLSDKLPDLIKAYGYDYEILDKENIKIAIEQINNCNNRKNICILEKDTFSKEELNNNNKLILSRYLPRSKYLKTLNKLFSKEDALLIGTTGNTAREMYNYMPDTNNFYMVGNMGGGLSLGLGAALGGKKVIVCGGDAEFVMHMGGLTTAGRYKGNINLTYILFDNESNKSTGGQKTYQNHLNYSNIAKNSGFTICDEIINDVNDFEKVLSGFTKKGGLNFVWVKCAYDEEVPRPPIENIKINNFVRRGND